MNQTSFTFTTQLIFAGLIIVAISNIGVLFERKKWAYGFEYFRLLANMLFVVYLSHQSELASLGLFLASILTFISLFWLMIVGRYMRKFY